MMRYDTTAIVPAGVLFVKQLFCIAAAYLSSVYYYNDDCISLTSIMYSNIST